MTTLDFQVCTFNKVRYLLYKRLYYTVNLHGNFDISLGHATKHVLAIGNNINYDKNKLLILYSTDDYYGVQSLLYNNKSK